MKKVLIVAAILAVIGTVVLLYVCYKPHQTAADMEIVGEVSATDLFLAFQNDEQGSYTKYVGENKAVKVTGTLEAVVTGDNGQKSYSFATGDMLGVVSCTFAEGEEVKEEIGASYTFYGICTGYITDVILNQCVLAE